MCNVRLVICKDKNVLESCISLHHSLLTFCLQFSKKYATQTQIKRIFFLKKKVCYNKSDDDNIACLACQRMRASHYMFILLSPFVWGVMVCIYSDGKY